MLGMIVNLKMLLDNFYLNALNSFRTPTLVAINSNHLEGFISYVSSCSVDLGEHKCKSQLGNSLRCGNKENQSTKS